MSHHSAIKVNVNFAKIAKIGRNQHALVKKFVSLHYEQKNITRHDTH
ncbi:hypothetical protein HMPREF0645_1766 [Hallella bergensis DSM 17361]|uniref:Uncharacterized protein n=1 Tax=Hallella bergensis DSM 17361 TaxID=585502 RepID=D1PXT1_9BACT|nr:hypothetical protein HMPREF0645_1766 [Hallella bergensis DSM 17361]